MKKLITVAALVVLGAARIGYADEKVKAAAPSGVTVEVKLAEEGHRLYANARLHGVPSGEVLYVHLEWKAPDVFFTNKKGEKFRLFNEGGKLPTKGDGHWAVGDKSGACFCKDSGEKGCWRTHADFLIEYTLDSGKTTRAVGTWTVSLVDDAGTVLGSGTYEVK
jgi:hypothetical protein